MPIPVRNGYMTQDFGVPGDYAAGYHTGRDYAGGTADVIATRAGVVTRVSYDSDYGNRVEILTEGIEHSYSHMANVAVGVNQQVMQGQYLGEMGSTGNSTAPHCHYEERYSPYGYSNHRRPVWDVDGGIEDGLPGGQEEDDMSAFVIVNRQGAAMLVNGPYISGLYDGDDLEGFQASGIPVVHGLSDRCFNEAKNR